MRPLFTSGQLRQLRRGLLAWFQRAARPLPWRATRDPYPIWISEVMLQQTQVKTVIPYFGRFLIAYPTLLDLSRADEQDVLRLWEGLGYYRRARDLLRSAQQLGNSNYTTIPNDPAIVRALPGFGRYTTNAVLSQAYDRRLPIVEANSQRVLTRLFGIAEDPKTPTVQKQLWQQAEALLPVKAVGDFNQAMMELGALVCLPSQPRCIECPLQRYCDANASNRQESIPWQNKLPKPTAVAEVAVVVAKNDKLLLVQRPDEGRWAKMWEFPHHELDGLETPETAAHRLMLGLGLAGNIQETLATIRHTVTRFQISMTCFLVQHRRGQVSRTKYRDIAWIGVEDLASYPLSAPQRQLALRLLEKAAQGGSSI
jgi:A/G-specific adenine glycosylase